MNNKQLSLVKNADLQVELNTGKSHVIINGITDKELGISVNTILNPESTENVGYGKGVKLNLQETLVKNTDDTLDASYIYKDPLGKEYLIKESFYYVNENGDRVGLEKDNVVITNEGKLQCTVNGKDYLVTRKELSEEGIECNTMIEDVDGIEDFDQSHDEIKQAKAQLDAHINSIKECVITNAAGNVMDKIDDEEIGNIKMFVEKTKTLLDDQLVLTKSEAMNLSSLYVQKTALNFQKMHSQDFITKYNNQIADYDDQKTIINKQILTMKANNNLNKEEMWHFFHNKTTNTTYSHEQVANYVAINEEGNIINPLRIEVERLYEEDYLNNIMAEVDSGNYYFMTKMNAVQYLSLKKQLTAIDNSISLVGTQISQLNRQMTDIESQIDEIQLQIDYLVSRSTFNISQLNEIFKRIILEFDKLRYLQKTIPVNYVLGEEYVKGFNAVGDLVLIQSKLGNQIAIEYDSTDATENLKIVRLYNKDSKEISLHYDSNGMLKEIINSQGEIITYEYNAEKYLSKVNYPNNKELTFERGTDYLKVTNDGKYAKVTYTDNNVTSVEYFTTIGEINNNSVTPLEEPQSLEKIDFECGQYVLVTNSEKKIQECYIFDTAGKLVAFRKLKDGKYVESKDYEYVKLGRYNISSVQENNLYGDFVTNDDVCQSTVTFDSFNRVKTESITNKTIHISDGVATKQDLVTTYTYNEKGQVSKSVTEERVYYQGENTNICSFTHIVLFEYNQNGQLVKKQSYTEGEEATNGINIEEHVYEKNGYEIKKITYNSLDPSSKYYEEIDVNEKGQKIASYDPTGKYLTKYKSGSSSSSNTQFPNGSTLSYGISTYDQSASITQSTADGEENSIKRLYTNGLLTKVIDGANEYEYSYEHKDRIKEIKINGEILSLCNYSEYDDEGEHIKNSVVEYVNDYAIQTIKAPNINQTVIYDDINGVKQKIVNYNKDRVSSVTTIIENVNYLTQYSYDDMGNLTEVEGAIPISNDQYKESYEYDGLGNLNLKIIRINDTILNAYQYIYSSDSRRKLERIVFCQNIFGALDASINISFKTDSIGRNKGKSIKLGNNNVLTENISYLKYNDHATNLPQAIYYNGSQNSIKYKYDRMGNICEIRENEELVSRYTYDSLNRLVREDNRKLNKTVLITYDNIGNILSKTKYPFTLKRAFLSDYFSESDIEKEEYLYENGRLISHCSSPITYNNANRPVLYKNRSLTWRFGKLANFASIDFEYDANGLRNRKKKVCYTYNNDGQLLKQFENGNELIFTYDNTGIVGFLNNRLNYFFKKDIFGNVIEILDSNGTTVVKYVYDAWGNHKVLNPDGTENTAEDFIGNINPIRYRSYYYDVETGWYYLQSRYYDPETCRFISQDDISYLDPETIGGTNLYAYCNNNPVMYVDPDGHGLISILIGIGVSALIGALSGAASYAVGQLISFAVTGKWSWSWGGFLGSVALGAITGAALSIVSSASGTISSIGSTIKSFLNTSFKVGSIAVAGGGTVAISVTGAQIAGAVLTGIASIVLFSKNNPNINSKAPFSWTNKNEGIDAMQRNNLDANKAAEDIMNSHFDDWHKGSGSKYNAIKKWLDRIIRNFLAGGK